MYYNGFDVGVVRVGLVVGGDEGLDEGDGVVFLFVSVDVSAGVGARGVLALDLLRFFVGAGVGLGVVINIISLYNSITTNIPNITYAEYHSSYFKYPIAINTAPKIEKSNLASRTPDIK